MQATTLTAYALAKEAADAAMRRAGRAKRNAEDIAAGNRVRVRLLMCVHADDGGLAGLSDDEREAAAERLRITPDELADAVYSSGSWDTEVQQIARAA